MSTTNLVGIVGGLILILGAARSEKKHPINPRKSIKEWLFAIGGLVMLIYAILAYIKGGNILYILLEIFVCFASRLKMMKVQGNIDIRMLGVLGLGLIVASYSIDHTQKTLRFIAGFIGISLGYMLNAGTTGRHASLTIGGILITIFSALQAEPIFFSVNLFFTFFSAFYWMKTFVEKKD